MNYDDKPLENAAQPKKPYNRPQLQVYGSLQELTQKHGDGSTNDGGTGSGKNTTKP